MSVSPTSPTVGQPLTFTAVVTGANGLPAPTGTITWAVSGQASSCTSTSTLASGQITAGYTCTVAAPVSGTYTVTATYNGDANFSALAPTTPLSVVVAPATPTIAITTSPSSPVLGGTITYTATITGITGASAPAGSITWSVTGQATSCASTTGPIAGGISTQTIFTCVVNVPKAGNYSASATYAGDTNYTALSATTLTTVTIAKAAPSVVLTGSGTGVLNGTLVFTATVTGTTGASVPTGTVTWTLSGTGGATSCTSTPAPTTSGVVTTYLCDVTAANYGTYVGTVNYGGDTNYLTVTSNSVTLGLSQVTPTISVVASASPTLGGTTTLTAIVTGPPGGAKPGGVMAWTVTNPQGASVPCTTTTAALTPSDPTIATAYSCTFPTAIAGNYSAQANFPGDLNYQLVNSSTITVTVPKATPVLGVTAFQSSGSSGQIVTYTATITGAIGSVAPTGAPIWTLTGPSTSCAQTTGPVTSGVSSIYTCVAPASLAGTYTGVDFVLNGW